MAIPEHRLSAWGANRVTSPAVLFEPSSDHGISPEWASASGTGGTVAHVPAQGAVRLAVTATSGSSAQLRSREQYRRAGAQGLRIGLTLYQSDGGQVGQVRRWGWFDDSDGVFFLLDGTTLSLVRRTKVSGSVVDADAIEKSVWSPPSAVIDHTKVRRYELELGPAEVRVFIDDVLVHTIARDGVATEALFARAALPVSVEVVNMGSSAIASITVLDGIAVVHGDPGPGAGFGASSGEKALDTSGVILLSIRAAALLNAIPNRSRIYPVSLSARVLAQAAAIRIVSGATIGGAPSWAASDPASGVEVDVAGTTATGGTLIAELELGAGLSQTIDLEPFFARVRRSLVVASLGGAQTPLSIVGVAASATPSARAALAWREVW